MSNGIELHPVGNLTRDIELRYSAQGKPWATFSIAVNEFQTVQGERREVTSFINCKIFGEAAENAAESLSKGMRVLVLGRLRQEKWTAKDGSEQTGYSLNVDEIGPSVRFARAQVTKTPRTGGDFSGRPATGGGGNDFTPRGGNSFNGGSRSSQSRGNDDFGGFGGGQPSGGTAAGFDPEEDNPFG